MTASLPWFISGGIAVSKTNKEQTTARPIRTRLRRLKVRSCTVTAESRWTARVCRSSRARHRLIQVTHSGIYTHHTVYKSEIETGNVIFHFRLMRGRHSVSDSYYVANCNDWDKTQAKQSHHIYRTSVE